MPQGRIFDNAIESFIIFLLEDNESDIDDYDDDSDDSNIVNSNNSCKVDGVHRFIIKIVLFCSTI